MAACNYSVHVLEHGTMPTLSIFFYTLTSEEDVRWCSGIPSAEGVVVEIKAKRKSMK